MKEIQKTQYDVVVIGAGSGGLTVAIGLASVGKSVLLVERELPGGECTHSGCIPSKALLHAAKTGMSSTAALEYTRSTIDHVYQEETPELLESHSITYLQGDARFTNKCEVSVAGTTYKFKKAVISTGSSPRMISIDGLQQQYMLTNQNIFDLTEIPAKLLVIGSGPIGMEMSQAFAMLGSDVTIATIDAKFARLEDTEISPLIEKRFADLGITILKNAYTQSVSETTATIDIKNDATNKDAVTETQQVDFDKVLIAIGRVANMPEGLDQATVTTSKYGIVTDDQYRTSNKHIYAIGDVSQTLKFTHTANEAGRVVTQHIITKGWWKAATGGAVPKVTYTIPEIASVGMSHEQAVSKYGAHHIVKISTPFSTNDRAKTDEAEEYGLAVVIAKKLSGKVLGANIIGQNAGEILASYTLAIDHKLSLWKLRKTIFPYPTISQIVRKSGDQFASHTIANLKPDLLLLVKHNLPKLCAAAFWLTAIAWFISFKNTNAYSFKDMLVMLYQFLSTNPLGVLIYIFGYTLRPLLFFPATVMTILSGILFGPIMGVIYTIIGENGSANLAYWVGRFFGADVHLEDNRLFGKWIQKAQDSPFIAVMTMRFIYLPFDLVNYGSGIAKIKWSAYALATLIGILPGLITFVLLGASLNIDQVIAANSLGELIGGFNPGTFAISAALFVSSIMFAKCTKRSMHNTARIITRIIATLVVVGATVIILNIMNPIWWQNFKLSTTPYWSLSTVANNPLLPGSDADLVETDYKDADVPPRIDLDDLLGGGPPKDGIPSINDPQFESINDTEFADDELIIGLYHNGVAKAYPYAILNWHELVNDTVGGTPVAVSYCPLCETNSVFVRELDGEPVEFGVSGKLYNSCLVMYDRKTDTLYSQPWGLGIVGEKTNHVLERLPATRTTIAAWRVAHPDSNILTTETGAKRDYNGYPYGSYYTNDTVIFPARNQNQLTEHPKEITQAVFQHDMSTTPSNVFAGDYIALTQKEVRAAGSVQFNWNGSTGTATWNSALETIEFTDDDGNTILDMALFNFVVPAHFK